MPLSSYYLSLLVSLGVLALTSSAPLDVQDDVTDYFKYPSEEDLNDSYFRDHTHTVTSPLERDLWEEKLLESVRDTLRGRLMDRQMDPSDVIRAEEHKRFRPQGYMASRGKRVVVPGLESLILAKYYKDNKWKRQPHLGFHGSRG